MLFHLKKNPVDKNFENHFLGTDNIQATQTLSSEKKNTQVCVVLCWVGLGFSKLHTWSNITIPHYPELFASWI